MAKGRRDGQPFSKEEAFKEKGGHTNHSSSLKKKGTCSFLGKKKGIEADKGKGSTPSPERTGKVYCKERRGIISIQRRLT